MTESQWTESDPWADIGVNARPDTVTLRRADPAHPLDFFRGRDSSGNYLFILQLETPVRLQTAIPAFAGIDVILRSRLPAGSELTISLQSRALLDIFRVLCGDLMHSPMSYQRGDDPQAVTTVVLRLAHWQELLRRLAQDTLGQHSAMGLFGEILLLRDFFLSRASAVDAVRAWRGPYSDQQDFMLNGWIVELKTQLATSDSKVRIASVDQLDVADGKLLLCHQSLDAMEATHPNARTLNSLVLEVRDRLASQSLLGRDLFLAGLVEVGYTRRDEYESWPWALNSRSWYQVRDGFPRLVPTAVPLGVENVTYSIRLDVCEPYRVRDGQIAEWISNGNT